MERPGAPSRPDDDEAASAVRTLIAWIGESPAREGLADTPRRVLGAFREYFAGYGQDAGEILSRTFDEVDGYSDPVFLGGIRFESHCEHHLAPFVGTVAIGYLPNGRVVGLSKLARLVDVFARRLQIQERLTAQIARALERHLAPNGVAVMVRAEHMCLSCRGAQKPGARMTTSVFTGLFRSDPALQARFSACVASDP